MRGGGEEEEEKQWKKWGEWVRDGEMKLEGERTNRQRTQQAMSWCHVLLRKVTGEERRGEERRGEEIELGKQLH